VADGVGVSKKF